MSPKTIVLLIVVMNLTSLVLTVNPLFRPVGSNALAQEANNTISIKANLKPLENQILPDDRGYKVTSFQFNATDAEELCPLGNCEYSIEDGQYRTFAAGGGYVFGGKLKATLTEEDTKKSKFYDMRADLRKIGSEETPSKVTEILEGKIGFQGSASIPEIEYPTVNGTLEVDEVLSILTLKGME